MRSIVMIAVLLVGGVSADASAQVLRHTYFGAMLGAFKPDDARGTDKEGIGGEVLIGRELNPNLYVEGRVFSNVFETGLGKGTDLYQSGVSGDLMLTVQRRGYFTPFVIGGLGFVYDDVTPNDRDSGNFYASAGVGLLSRALSRSGIRIRVEARAAYDDFEEGVTDARFGIGLEVPIAAAEIVVREVPVASSAPAGPPPGGYPPRPAPGGLDSDKDGVLDNFDRCPDTLPGAKVNRAGCVDDEQTVAVLYAVHFEWGKTRLLPDARTILNQAVDALKGQRSLQVQIIGHADSTGTEEVNLAISLARADSVREYLVSRGIDGLRLSTAGYGEAQPVDDNATEMGRWENRRVEFRLSRP